LPKLGEDGRDPVHAVRRLPGRVDRGPAFQLAVGPGFGFRVWLAFVAAGRPRDALVFTAPQGGTVTDGHFRNRVWYPAVAAAGIRRFPPRIMRHTAASWLVQDGVPLMDVQMLLGHEDYATTQRYAHLAPHAHEKVIKSWARASAARQRENDARVTHMTHERKDARPS
jgi:hypothetical protein